MNDGGRPGHRSQLVNLKSGEDAVLKGEKALAVSWLSIRPHVAQPEVTYDKESLLKRKERMKGASTIKQLENIYVLMAPSGCRVAKKKRS